MKAIFWKKKDIPRHIKTRSIKKRSRTLADKHKPFLDTIETRFLRHIENKTKRDREWYVYTDKTKDRSRKWEINCLDVV